jgi:hypothetical protein
LFQSGLPLALTTANNVIGTLNGTSRPNVVQGCQDELSGSAAARVNEWFNTACFTAPTAYTFGTVSRTLPDVRSAGSNNWDFAVFKNTKLNERFGLEFRVEVFNLFNSTACSLASPTKSWGTRLPAGSAHKRITRGWCSWRFG